MRPDFNFLPDTQLHLGLRKHFFLVTRFLDLGVRLHDDFLTRRIRFEDFDFERRTRRFGDLDFDFERRTRRIRFRSRERERERDFERVLDLERRTRRMRFPEREDEREDERECPRYFVPDAAVLSS